MKILQILFNKKDKVKVADAKDTMSITRAILKESDTTLLRIFDEYKMELLDKDSDYIIYSVCGSSEKGPLTKQQMAIHNHINPAINKMCDLLRIEELSEERKQTIRFVIRLMVALKILFMMEVFKNVRNQDLVHKGNIQETLEKMETLGHA